MRIFADTNFLVSAFITRGLSAELLDQIIEADDFQLVIGEIVLSEFEKIMLDKIKMPTEKVDFLVTFLKRFEFFPAPQTSIPYELDDSDDQWVLANAIDAKADVLITGDKHFLKERDQVKELEILSPREFWEKRI